MAQYRVKFYYPDGVVLEETTHNQPDRMEDFLGKMTRAEFQSFVAQHGQTGTVASVKNVLKIEAVKL